MGFRLSEVLPAYSRLAGLQRARVWGKHRRYLVMTVLQMPAVLLKLVSPHYPVRETQLALT